MTPTKLMLRVARVFESLGIPYAVTGSMASMFYGEMRTTNDVDVIARLGIDHVKAFVSCFPEDEFYVSEEAVRSAIEHRSQFNIIHPTSGFKVDVIIPKDVPHDKEELSRAVRITRPPDVHVMMCTAEDVIVKKLWFYEMGGSDKHLRDIASMLKVSRERIDRAYIEAWADRLGLIEIWRLVLGRVSG